MAGPEAAAQVTAQLGADKILKISGRNDDERIVLAPGGPVLFLVTRDGQGNVVRKLIPRGRVHWLEIRMWGGKDLVVNLTSLPSDTWAGTGDDTIVAGLESDDIEAGDGADTILGRDGMGHLQGQDGDDILVGGKDFDFLCGGMGHDMLWGRLERSLMLGHDVGPGLLGDGNDVLVGGPAVDDLYGNDGNDWLWGFPDSDGLGGDNGDDVLCGGDDNDTLDGGPGDDEVYGENGADDHDGGLGKNELFGNPLLGDTFKNGRQNPETLCVGHGSGEMPTVTSLAKGALLLRYRGGLLLMGTEGADALHIDAKGGTILLSATLAGGEAPLRAELPRDPPGVRLYVDARGGDDRVLVTGGVQALVVEGGDGNDEIDGQGVESGAVVLIGGAGADTIRAGPGGGVLAGEDGDDVLIPGSAADLVSTGSGRDEVRAADGIGTVLERWRPDRDELLQPSSSILDARWLPWVVALGAGVTAFAALVVAMRRRRMA